MKPESSPDNTYILGHSHAEMVRLTEQDHHITEGMGGLFPEQPDLSGINRILDVACGPGGWPLEVAYAYPDKQVVGIDVDEGMISYATELARAARLDNVSFRVMNAIEPLDFPDAYFDLVNARFMVGFLPTTLWPAPAFDVPCFAAGQSEFQSRCQTYWHHTATAAVPAPGRLREHRGKSHSLGFFLWLARSR